MIARRLPLVAVAVAVTLLAACDCPFADPTATPTPTASASATEEPSPTPTDTPTEPPSEPTSAPSPEPTNTQVVVNPYPWHTGIVATTFWVGEIFDATADDGSQVISTYDSNWLANYGGCDGVEVDGVCSTEARTAANGYVPSAMTPKQNPFYLDLPFDDVNDAAAFARRATVIPWANLSPYAANIGDPGVSLMKNRWVELRKGDEHCYGQIEDAGPGEYNDAEYVFGMSNARPANARYGGAGMDVSPALNGCLGFADLDGDADQVDWRFIEASEVPDGPWLTTVTKSGVK